MPDDDGAPPDGAAAAPEASGPAADVPHDTAAGPAGPAGPAEDGPVEPGPVVVENDGVANRLVAVEVALVALERRRDDESERAAARERVIERQHADIERMRVDERFGVLQPVLVDLGTLRNDLLRQAVTLPADLSVERMVTLLESFAASVEDTLLRCGVEPQPREVGVPFLPRHQRVARVVETDDAQRDGTVAEIVQDGYVETGGGRVVIPARVAVHRAVDRNATKEHADV